MLRQRHCSPHRLTEIGGRVLSVGTVPVGTIRKLSGATVIVEARLPRECHADRRDHQGRWASSFHTHGMFLAQVRRLADGQRSLISDIHLIEREARQ
ncbi:hypothetical protein [Pelagibius sp.]|uniref:hypothetical protein n=1 Tax=Pelagibius sp. TaxID=1931238 RepID=UPI003B5063A9